MATDRSGGGGTGGNFEQQLEWFIDGLMEHESGGRNVDNPDTSASGFWQYTDGTWNNYGGYSSASDAPYAVQRERVEKDVRRNYQRYGNWQQTAAHHFYPAWADNPGQWHKSPGHPSNPSMQSFVDSVMGNMEQASQGRIEAPAALSGDPLSTRFGGGGGGAGGGGGSGGGGGTSPSGVANAPGVANAEGQFMPASAEVDPQTAEDMAFQLYGATAKFFLEHPEIGPIIKQAADEGWDAGRTIGAVQKTDYWKSTSKAVRTYDSLQATDPGQVRRLHRQKRQVIDNMAAEIGINIGSTRRRELTRRATRLGWSDQELTEAMVDEHRYNPHAQRGGQIGDTIDELRSRAQEYGVPLSKQALNAWAERIVVNESSPDDYENYVQRLAKGRFPHLSDEIDRGITVRQYADPYIQTYARMMETNPQGIGLDNKHVSAMMDFRDPDEGERRSMTLSEAQAYIRSQDSWRRTRQAHEEYTGLANNLLEMFGARSR